MDTRDLIIETAFIAFLEKGYDRVSLNQIVKNTGLTKGAFYHNFSSKSELIHEVMKKYFFVYMDQSMTLIDDLEDNLQDKLIKIYSRLSKIDLVFQAYPEKKVNPDAFMFLFQECIGIDTELRKLAEEQQKRTVKIMAEAIIEATKKNEVAQEIDPFNLAELINAMIRGTMLITAYRNPLEKEKMLKKNIETLLSLIL